MWVGPAPWQVRYGAHRMTACMFASDLHGHTSRYEKLFAAIRSERPHMVFLAGDLLPSGLGELAHQGGGYADFFSEYLVPGLSSLKGELGGSFPEILLILGNDDPRGAEDDFLAEEGLWHYVHGRRHACQGFTTFGYGFVPPTPFLFKDWERYDVSRYVPPGCVSPEEGFRSLEVDDHWVRYGTIQKDLEELVGDADMRRAVLLCHTPPYDTALDRAALDGRMVDHVPLDLHVGSIAVQRFIAARQPTVALHGHIHESARITGSWRDMVGKTHVFSAAHDGPELALVRFDLERPEGATRVLL